jgi:hypothetical protein
METASRARHSSLVGTMRFLKPLLLLLIPFSADLLSNEVYWSITDHLVTGAMLLSAAAARRWTWNRWPERKRQFNFLDRDTFYSSLGRVGCRHMGHIMSGIIGSVIRVDRFGRSIRCNSGGSKGMSEGSSVCRLLFRSLNAVVLHSTENLQRAGVSGARASVFLNAFNGS